MSPPSSSQPVAWVCRRSWNLTPSGSPRRGLDSRNHLVSASGSMMPPFASQKSAASGPGAAPGMAARRATHSPNVRAAAGESLTVRLDVTVLAPLCRTSPAGVRTTVPQTCSSPPRGRQSRRRRAHSSPRRMPVCSASHVAAAFEADAGPFASSAISRMSAALSAAAVRSSRLRSPPGSPPPRPCDSRTGLRSSRPRDTHSLYAAPRKALVCLTVALAWVLRSSRMALSTAEGVSLSNATPPRSGARRAAQWPYCRRVLALVPGGIDSTNSGSRSRRRSDLAPAKASVSSSNQRRASSCASSRLVASGKRRNGLTCLWVTSSYPRLALAYQTPSGICATLGGLCPLPLAIPLTLPPSRDRREPCPSRSCPPSRRARRATPWRWTGPRPARPPPRPSA